MLHGLPGNPTSSLHGGLASSLPAALPWTPPLPFLVPPSGPSPNHSLYFYNVMVFERGRHFAIQTDLLCPISVNYRFFTVMAES
ncbi:hypothetical protein STEG23_025959, partial [Scotinomys teguina]